MDLNINQRNMRKVVKTVIKALIYSPIFIVMSRTVTYLSPGEPHSSSNNLHFALVNSDSPLHGDAYPVDLLVGVVPKRFHSHNDYAQSKPLIKALSYGAGSVEADIWLVKNELYVGHDAKDIRPERTLAALYLDPLVAMIKAANAQHNGTRLRGIYETAPHLPLHLLIDIKTNGPSTFAKLYTALEPLRAAGYLTSWSSHSEGGKTTPSVITIIGTGNTPLASVQALGHTPGIPRDIFFDAELDLIPGDSKGIYTPEVSPLASSDFKKSVGQTWTVPSVARAKIRRLTKAAHDRGIQARFWRTPGRPVAARNGIWQMLLDEGVDWLNVDDLPAAKDF